MGIMGTGLAPTLPVKYQIKIVPNGSPNADGVWADVSEPPRGKWRDHEAQYAGHIPAGHHMVAVQTVWSGRDIEFFDVIPVVFIAARDRSTRPQMFSPLTVLDLAGYQLFMNSTGTVGAAISPDGDVQNVFNNTGIGGCGGAAIQEAIRRGGKTLDVYGDELATIYARHGFVAVRRERFNPAYRTPLWSFERDGWPDVIFMELRRA